MKKLFLFLYSTFYLLNSTFAQTDSVRIIHTQETGTLEKQRFIDQYDYVFMTKEPTKSMLKGYISAAPLPNLSLRGPSDEISSGLPQNVSYSFGYEQKIGKSFSIDLNLTGGYFSELFWNYHFASAELRWFYDMKKRIQKDIQVSNLTGNYLSIKYGKSLPQPSFRPLTVFLELPFILNKTASWYKIGNTFALKIGTQRRFMRRGFIDFSLNTGYVNYESLAIFSNPRLAPDNEWFLFTDVKLGLSLTSLKPKKLIDSASCEVWKCFEEEKNLWKISLTSPLMVTNNQAIVAIPLSFEQKIRKSAWSINTDLNLSIQNYSSKSAGMFGPDYFNSSASVVIQPRYYYNLKKRIREGKSANNLSGNYVSLAGNQSLYFFNFREMPVSLNKKQRGWNNTRAAFITWGMQRRIFSKGFFDFQAGAMYGERSTVNHQPLFEPYTRFKLGFAL